MPDRLTATAINCSLSASGRKGPTDAMIAVLAEHFQKHDVIIGKPNSIVAHSVRWGVSSDEGDGDEWPNICEQILASDILIFGTPIWMGQPSSVAKLALERMDAFLDETDEAGRMSSYSKVAVASIVGNEDGRPSCLRGTLPGAQRHGMDDPRSGGMLPGRRSYGIGRLQGC